MPTLHHNADTELPKWLDILIDIICSLIGYGLCVLLSLAITSNYIATATVLFLLFRDLINNHKIC